MDECIIIYLLENLETFIENNWTFNSNFKSIKVFVIHCNIQFKIVLCFKNNSVDRFFIIIVICKLNIYIIVSQ